jgi:hypothetical protein
LNPPETFATPGARKSRAQILPSLLRPPQIMYQSEKHSQAAPPFPEENGEETRLREGQEARG